MTKVHALGLATLFAAGLGFPAGALAATAQLSWSAPGDDSLAGRAAAYDVRYSTQPITAANFGAATQVQGEPVPASPGTRQSLNVNGLQNNATYYFAMKTVDDFGNWSGLSNLGIKGNGTVDVTAGAPALGFSPPRPNPARSAASFVLSLPSAADVEVAVFDPTGRRVRTLVSGRQAAGEIHVAWDLLDGRGIRMATGYYLVRARLANATFVRSVVVAR